MTTTLNDNGVLEAALGFASALLVTAFAAWVGVRLAIRRFYEEKFVERRWDAYVAAIGAIADIHYELLQQVARDAGAQHLPAFDIQRLHPPIKAIHRSAAFGLLFSPEMRKIMASIGPLLQASGTDAKVASELLARALEDANKTALKDLPPR